MGYTDSLLANGEHQVLADHQHPFVLIWNARGGVLAIVLAILLMVLRTVANGSSAVQDVLGYASLALLVIGLLLVLWSWLRFTNEVYLITNRRIIHAEGVINKRASDSSLEKINDAILSESLFGRIFGFGDLEVDTASESGIERLRMLRDAKEFKKGMLEAKHSLEVDLTRPVYEAAAPQAPAAPTVQAAPPAPVVLTDHMTGDEVANAVDRLGELRDKGLITPEEFDAKKRELLSRL